jgi:hypothetical protein
MAIRITYDTKTIDLLVGEAGLQPAFKQERNQNRSASGKIETINLHGIQELRFAAYFDADTYYDLVGWWSWARQGKVWAFALDSSDTVDTTLDDAAAAAQKVVPLTATTGLAVDDYCLIRADDNDDEFEIVKIASISAGESITAVANLKFAYTSGDIFRHVDYWPEVVSMDADFSPVKSGDYYRHTFKFVENL